jgi:hypothetical protein
MSRTVQATHPLGDLLVEACALQDVLLGDPGHKALSLGTQESTLGNVAIEHTP